jgi:glycosyltransferase involved in cell wall biosynthesis
MKVLLHSNAPWAPTGYGQQVKLFAPRLAEHYELAISSFYGLEGDRLNWDGIQVFPGLGGEFGNDYLVKNAERYFGGAARAGLILTLMDVWVLRPDVISQLNVASWAPVDHEPAPPAVIEYFRRSGAIPIAMTRFGQEELIEFDPLYVPHGVDTSVFKPYPQAEAREQVGADKDAFIVGMVAANKGKPSRKCFQEALQAFAIFRERHDDAILYLHTDLTGDEDILSLKESLQIPDDAVRMADQYRINLQPLPPAMMARVYSTFDVLLNPSAGEGFGVPIIEAQACGVPAIVTDFSAMKEVCGAGWKVGCRADWTGQRSWQARPNVEEIVASLEECYGLTAPRRKEIAKTAVSHARTYDADRVLTEHFLPALKEIERRLTERNEEREPVVIKAAA